MVIDIAVASYALAALAFLALGVVLLVKWKGQRQEAALLLACALTAAWAATLAWHAARAIPLSLVPDLMELLRNAGWSLFLLLLMGFFQPSNSPAGVKTHVSVIAIGVFYAAVLAATVALGWVPDDLSPVIGMVAGPGSRVMASVLGLLLVEQLYRTTRVEQRWGIKFACFGIGGLFVYDFYLYSDAMLFRHVDSDIWLARGVVNALIAPLIAVSALRTQKWSRGIAISRRILFHSAALFGSAIYLLMMASAGYYLRFFGGSWGAVMQTGFLFGGAILLIGILFSGAFRSWLRVFISKNFYSYHYDYREEWLGFTHTLSEDGPNLKERVIQALAKLVESPGGALFFSRESGHCESVAQWNMSPAREFDPDNVAFFQFLAQKQWVVDLQECAAHPQRYDHVAVPAWLRALPSAWLVAPLGMHGKLMGFVVLARSRSAMTLNWETTDLLKIAGMQAASYLAQQESATALMIARQFESFNRMSTFVVHDLKNLVLQLSLLMSNAEKHRDNPEFQKDMMETIDYSVQKMRLLLQKLSRKETVERRAPLRIDELLQGAVKSKSGVEPKPALDIGDPGLRVMADPERLARVLGHIIQNAIEATPRDGSVRIAVVKDGDRAAISVTDTGAGMSAQFMRDQLFKPFETTKAAGMGIGMFESREYIHELGGRLTAESREQGGTVFRVLLPLHAPAVQQLQEETSEPG